MCTNEIHAYGRLELKKHIHVHNENHAYGGVQKKLKKVTKKLTKLNFELGLS